jgi:alkylation response protein AidB-like acyl-CoA dehydrogenase/acyl carrier protein
MTDQNERVAVEELLSWLRDYAGRRLNSFLMDERRCMPPHLVLEFAERGLLGIGAPRKWGGLGLSTLSCMRVFAQLGGIDLSIASFVGVHTVLGTRPIAQFGSRSLQAQWLPRLSQGRVLGAFAITEVSGGSNPRAMAAEARPIDGGGLRLDGTKEWIGNGSWAGVITVFAKEFASDGRPLGISAFAVPGDAPGLRHGAEALTMGMRAMVQNRVHFEGVQVPQEARVGEAGQGLQVASDAMNYGRLGIAAMAGGAMKRCLQLWHRFADRRVIATGPLLANPVTLRRMSEVAAATQAIDALVEGLARLRDTGTDLPDVAYMACKVLAPELLWQTVDHAMQGLGGRGYMEANGLAQLLRDARLLRIFEGPTEALTAAIGADVSTDPSGLTTLMDSIGARGFQQRLERVLAAAADRGAGSELRSTRYRLGHATSWMILQGFVDVWAREGSPESQQVARWAALRSEQAIKEVSSDPWAAIALTSEEISQRVRGVALAIGEVHPVLADEERGLDRELSLPEAAKEAASRASRDALPTSQTGAVPAPPAAGHEAPRAAADATWDPEELEAWMCESLASALRIPVEEVDPATPFSELGVDSAHALALIEKLERRMQRSLDATLMWSYPTIGKLVRHLADAEPGAPESVAPSAGVGELTRQLAAELAGGNSDD